MLHIERILRRACNSESSSSGATARPHCALRCTAKTNARLCTASRPEHT